MPAFVDTMAYVGEVPWHKLGTCLGDQNVDGKTMQTAAGLDWEVSLRQAWYYDDSKALREIEGHSTLVRSDTGRSLGAVVGARYTLFQNRALFECMESLRDASGGGVKFHTAGALMGGRKVWALAQLEGMLDIRIPGFGSDVSVPFILGYTTHDGSSAITYRLCRERVVCHNTVTTALSESGRPEYKVRHTASAPDRIVEAAAVLGLASEGIKRQNVVLQALADTPMDREAFRGFACAMLTGEDVIEAAVEVVRKSEGRSRAQYERKGAELVQLFNSGLGNHGRSRYDALNALTEYVDHQRGRGQDWREMDAERLDTCVDSLVFGAGERMKTRALELLAVAA